MGDRNSPKRQKCCSGHVSIVMDAASPTMHGTMSPVGTVHGQGESPRCGFPPHQEIVPHTLNIQGSEEPSGDDEETSTTMLGRPRDNQMMDQYANFMFDADSKRWVVPALVLVLILLVTAAGALVYSFVGEETLAASCAFFWTASAALVAWGFSIHYHTVYERQFSGYNDQHEDDKMGNGENGVRADDRPKGKLYSIKRRDYRLCNLKPKSFCTEERFKMKDQLQLRALDYARQYSELYFRKTDVLAELGWEKWEGTKFDNVGGNASAALGKRNVRKMIHMIKEHGNKALPARWRWVQFLVSFLIVNYLVSFVPVYACVKSQHQVSTTAAWIIIVGTILFTISIIYSASIDRDAAILAPPGSMVGLSFMLGCGASGQSMFTLALSETDICETIDQYWIYVVIFCGSLCASMILAMRMLLGKLVDYCEMRIELLAIGLGPTFRKAKPPRSVAEWAEMKYPLDQAELSFAAARKLKTLTVDLWERWGIGLGVIFLGLVPSLLKVGHAMMQGVEGESPWEVLPEEIYTMIGTTFVLITLFLSDPDLRGWLNTKDKVMWVSLSLLTLFAEVVGAILGVQAAWRSRNLAMLMFLLCLALLFVTLQLCTCVWMSLMLDLRLVKLVYRGHTYLCRRELSQASRASYKAPVDGLNRKPRDMHHRTTSDSSDDSDEEDIERRLVNVTANDLYESRDSSSAILA